MPTLVNTNPLGDVYVALLRRDVTAGEEFEVTDEQAAALLEQAGNYAVVNADLDSLTVEQLRDYAEARDIDLTGLTKKPEIITAIKKG